jgi:hypothetical protein
MGLGLRQRAGFDKLSLSGFKNEVR